MMSASRVVRLAKRGNHEKIGRRINVTRVQQVLPLAPAVIATACPYC
jgi:hypothetical protein